MNSKPRLPRFDLVLLLTLLAAGCVQTRQTANPVDPLGITLPGVEYYDNPVQIPPGEPELVWETVIDVLDDYFEIDEHNSEPLRQVDNFVLEGHVETMGRIGATVLEPWRHDSANLHERIESTVQSIRRKAVVRVIPDETGYKVDVAVYKYLEDVIKPEHSSAGAATFRYDDSLNRVVNPVLEAPIDAGWILLGRDMALEQRIIAQILSRTGTVCMPCGPTTGPTMPVAQPGAETPLYNPNATQGNMVPMNPTPTPIPTPAPQNQTYMPGQGNSWGQDPNSTYSVPAPGWQPK